MAEIVDQCQALVDEHFDPEARALEENQWLMPNSFVDRNSVLVPAPRSSLPDEVVDRIQVLSCAFMDYPDDIAQLGMRYYKLKS